MKNNNSSGKELVKEYWNNYWNSLLKIGYTIIEEHPEICCEDNNGTELLGAIKFKKNEKDWVLIERAKLHIFGDNYSSSNFVYLSEDAKEYFLSQGLDSNVVCDEIHDCLAEKVGWVDKILEFRKVISKISKTT